MVVVPVLATPLVQIGAPFRTSSDAARAPSPPAMLTSSSIRLVSPGGQFLMSLDSVERQGRIDGEPSPPTRFLEQSGHCARVHSRMAQFGQVQWHSPGRRAARIGRRRETLARRPLELIADQWTHQLQCEAECCVDVGHTLSGVTNSVRPGRPRSVVGVERVGSGACLSVGLDVAVEVVRGVLAILRCATRRREAQILRGVAEIEPPSGPGLCIHATWTFRARPRSVRISTYGAGGGLGLCH